MIRLSCLLLLLMTCFTGLTAEQRPRLTVVHVTHQRDVSRAWYTLFSVQKNVAPGILEEYVLVVPPPMMKHKICFQVSESFPVRCLNQRNVIKGLPSEKKIEESSRDGHGMGYRIQMLLKLYAARFIETEYYITLGELPQVCMFLHIQRLLIIYVYVDSDLLLVRQILSDEPFLPHSKAYVVPDHRGMSTISCFQLINRCHYFMSWD